MLLLLHLLSLVPGVFFEEIVTSQAALARLASMERELVELAKEHAGKMEAAVAAIEEYVDQVSEVYKVACKGGECSESQLQEKVLGNPIYNYQLLKRVTVYWANVEKAIDKVDREAMLSKVRKIKRRSANLPSEADLQQAARTLTRLADVYSLNPEDLAAGSLMGLATGAVLSTKDTYYLARTAAMQEKPELAAGLAEAAIAMAARVQNSTSVGGGGGGGVQVGAMQQMLQQQRQKVKQAKGVEENKEEFRLGVIPPRTSDGRQLTTDQDRINFNALCRGESLLRKETEALLFCQYSDRGDPFFRLHPVPVEVLHHKPHEVLLFHNVISSSESVKLGDIAANKLKQSAIGQAKELSEIRVSRNAWLEDGVAPMVDKINLRTDRLTKLQSSATWAKFGEGMKRKEEFEFLQVAEYGIGGHYNVHQDPMYVYKDSTFIAESVESKVPYLTGDRMSTLMYYLSDVPAGGVTAFPRLGVAAKPELGAAIFWHNIKRSGASDMAMLHGGCPVVLGAKMVANKWMREVAQMQHRSCGLSPDDQ